MQKRQLAIAIGAAGALIGMDPADGTVQVMYSQISGHPTALVPPGAGLAAGTEFRVVTTTGFDRPFASPDGTKIFFTGSANTGVTSDDECYIVWDNGTATTVAREGTNFGSPTADNLALGDQRMGINNNGHFVFSCDTTAATTMDEMVIKWDGANFVIVAREGDAVPGAATELFGGAMNSGHILADGTPAFCAPNTNGTLPTAEDDFCFNGASIVVQSGNVIEANVWSAFNDSDWWVTPDGAHWMLVGDDNQATTTNRILVVDGVVRAREGVPLIGSSYVSNVSTSFGGTESILCNDGSYMLRGHNVDLHDWVLRNGTVIAEKGGSVATSTTELWDDTTFGDLFFFIAGNSVGDYVIGGLTDEADITKNAVLAYNGTDIVAREGDMVDLNGNGLPDDDAFISVFNNDDGVLTDSGMLVFFANCVDGLGTSIGQMVLRIDIEPVIVCVPDIAPPGGDGTVGVPDLLAIINGWGPCDEPCPPSCAEDIAPRGGDCTVGVPDLLAVINGWGSCP